MRFEGRELKQHAEAVPADELKDGAVYFLVEFLDKEMLLPRLEPVVYLGKDLSPGDVGCLYLQDAESFRNGVRLGDQSDDEDEPLFIQTPADGMRPVFEYERALDVLMACSLRRQGITGTM